MSLNFFGEFGLGLPQQCINKCGLTMINVCNNSYISYIHNLKNKKPRTREVVALVAYI